MGRSWPDHADRSTRRAGSDGEEPADGRPLLADGRPRGRPAPSDRLLARTVPGPLPR